MRTSNPTLSDRFFKDLPHSNVHMTIDGTVNKLFMFLLLLVFSATFTWINADSLGPYLMILVIGSVIGSLILALIIIFNQKLASTLGFVYALFEGVLIGLISLFAEMQFPGIVLQAVGLTFATAFAMLILYRLKWIEVTEKFKMGLFAAMGAIFLIYLVSFVMSFFGKDIPLINSNGPIGIIFSLIVVTIAALNLVLDFDFIEKAANQKLPKYMEYYAAFGLLVTLVWLYIEILRLLTKMRSSD